MARLDRMRDLSRNHPKEEVRQKMIERVNAMVAKENARHRQTLRALVAKEPTATANALSPEAPANKPAEPKPADNPAPAAAPAAAEGRRGGKVMFTDNSVSKFACVIALCAVASVGCKKKETKEDEPKAEATAEAAKAPEVTPEQKLEQDVEALAAVIDMPEDYIQAAEEEINAELPAKPVVKPAAPKPAAPTP
jgi:hypothetical protein